MNCESLPVTMEYGQCDNRESGLQNICAQIRDDCERSLIIGIS